MDAAWLTYSLALTGMRMFECGDFTIEECDYYKQRWHFWYIADYVFALPTVAFFMCTIGVFIVGHAGSTLLLRRRNAHRSKTISKPLAMIRYLSYRGFHVPRLQWNSAPVGVLLLGAVGIIFFFSMDLAPKPYYWVDEMFGGSPPLATRSGWLALGCMPFIFATASKANWITLLTGVSHERLQVFHRWISYAFFVLALLHTFPFIVYHVHWHDMEMHFSESLLFYWTGIVAIICQAWLTFMSHSTIRHFGYEFFKISHFACVVVFMITFFWHCDYTLTSWHYFVATAAIYVPCWLFPWLRTIFEYKWTQQAHIVAEDNGYTRVTILANLHWTPGQHCFLRFTSFGILHAISAHPFTICSSPTENEKGQVELIFYIRCQRGFTKALHQHALDHPGIAVPVLVDGPYGGVQLSRLHSAQHQLVIAGGSGAGWCLPFIKDFITKQGRPCDEEAVHATANKDVGHPAHGSLRIILATRDISSRIWFERTVDALIVRCGSASRSSVNVQVFLTGEAAETADPLPQSPAGIRASRSESSQENVAHAEKGVKALVQATEYKGRPRLSSLIQEEADHAAVARENLAVFVCGPLTMQDDVRNAVADQNLEILKGARPGDVYLHTEHFSWA
ncbi:hypothetical protein ACN47E_000902 [Coniothyrium glycines]